MLLSACYCLASGFADVCMSISCVFRFVVLLLLLCILVFCVSSYVLISRFCVFFRVLLSVLALSFYACFCSFVHVFRSEGGRLFRGVIDRLIGAGFHECKSDKKAFGVVARR